MALYRCQPSNPIKRLVLAKLEMYLDRLSLGQVQVAVARPRLERRCQGSRRGGNPLDAVTDNQCDVLLSERSNGDGRSPCLHVPSEVVDTSKCAGQHALDRSLLQAWRKGRKHLDDARPR